MLKTIIAGSCVVMLYIQMYAKPYRDDISTNQYIACLKIKLANLHAEEAVLKNSFQLTREKCILFGSMGIIKGICYFGEISELLNRNVARAFGYGYPAIILTYCWIRMMKYLFIKGDIEAVEQELEALIRCCDKG